MNGKLSAVGYQVHEGGPTKEPNLQGRWWWSRERKGWSEAEFADGDFDTSGQAWADADRAFKEELQCAAKGFTPYTGSRPLAETSIDDIPAAEQAAFWESLGMYGEMSELDMDLLYGAWNSAQQANKPTEGTSAPRM